jgi:uncharacterized protein (DUF362 family)
MACVAGGSAALLGLSSCGGGGELPPGRIEASPPKEGQPYLAVARGADPAGITRAAIEAIGGMRRFVPAGSDVVIKPNICVNYHPPEYAATTNPDVVAEIVRMCLEAGAARARVMDMPFGGTPESAYKVSGIAAAVEAAGGTMEQMSPVGFVETAIPDGIDLTEWDIYSAITEANVVINVPIAKHHSLARLTMGGKNLLGVVSRPQLYHTNLGQRVADLLSLVRPTLTVVDAYRILTAHGPTGGSLNDVTLAETVIASHDTVAADAYGATMFGLTGSDIPFIQAAADMGLGTLDLGSVDIAEVTAA